MEQRLANSWRMTTNERTFVEAALASDIRVDGRRPFDYRRLTIEFGREDGSSKVLLGQTYVMGYVTAQLVQPYRDRPNEGTFSVFTEFSPMADPSFEAGRPGESAIELGRVIDRGLRESKAVDMESLCVVSGKSVWAIRVDLHILDNGGNLIDAANIAALAALMVFRRPECTLGGENNQDVIVHDPEVREPLPLIIHHLPIAVTFAFFGEGNVMVIDPSYKEEAVMGGRMTATLNANGDICTVQKAGGEGVMSSVIMQCLRIASVKAADMTSKIKNAVDAYDNERVLRKVKRHQSLVGHEVSIAVKVSQVENLNNQGEAVEDEPERSCNQVDDMVIETSTSRKKESRGNSSDVFVGGPSKWDPYSTGNILRYPRSSQNLPGPLDFDGKQESGTEGSSVEIVSEQMKSLTSNSPMAAPTKIQQNEAPKSLKDAVKPKGKKKNRT